MSYIIPIGPYHPALEEPVHARLYTEGEVIKDAEVFVGYNHRGIEKLATERNAIQTLVLVERVCGICSHSHAFTYALCVEDLNGLEVPKRGDRLHLIESAMLNAREEVQRRTTAEQRRSKTLEWLQKALELSPANELVMKFLLWLRQNDLVPDGRKQDVVAMLTPQAPPEAQPNADSASDGQNTAG